MLTPWSGRDEEDSQSLSLFLLDKTLLGSSFSKKKVKEREKRSIKTQIHVKNFDRQTFYGDNHVSQKKWTEQEEGKEEPEVERIKWQIDPQLINTGDSWHSTPEDFKIW